MKGVAYPAISDSSFWTGKIPLPPPPEQARIVAKVDELMVLCDALEARQTMTSDSTLLSATRNAMASAGLHLPLSWPNKLSARPYFTIEAPAGTIIESLVINDETAKFLAPIIRGKSKRKVSPPAMKQILTILIALLLVPLAAIDAEAAQAPANETSSAQSSVWIAVDYILPAYVNLTAATLFVRPTSALQGPPVEVRVTFNARLGGLPPRTEMRITLNPGKECRLTLDIADWADGDYRTEIQCFRDGRELGEPLVRWLRKQTIPAPPTSAEPIDVRGLTTLFVDDEYIHFPSGLRRAVNPAETFAVTTGRMDPERPEQKPEGGIKLEPDGTWVVKFTDEEREDRHGATTRHYTARSSDARAWTVMDSSERAIAPQQEFEGSFQRHSFCARSRTGHLQCSEVVCQ